MISLKVFRLKAEGKQVHLTHMDMDIWLYNKQGFRNGLRLKVFSLLPKHLIRVF